MKELYTPLCYIESSRLVMGGIDLDPASSFEANSRIKAKRIFSEFDDGLTHKWYGRVFLHPPQDLDKVFCNKALSEYKSGRVAKVMMLVRCQYYLPWQEALFSYPLCLVHHKIPYLLENGKIYKSTAYQDMFVYLGKDIPVFETEFRKYGYIMAHLSQSTHSTP